METKHTIVIKERLVFLTCQNQLGNASHLHNTDLN